MATPDEVRQLLFDRIAESAKEETNAPRLLELAEAYAWLSSTGQAHGGRPTTTQ